MAEKTTKEPVERKFVAASDTSDEKLEKVKKKAAEDKEPEDKSEDVEEEAPRKKPAKADDGEKKAPKKKKAEDDDEDELPEKPPKARATTLRIIAAVLWFVAIAFEVLVILLLNRTLYIPSIPGLANCQLIYMIAGIAIDLICAVIGSLLWKKANHIDPASKKHKVRFFLWNNLGVLMVVLAFVPLIIYLLANKKLKGKPKTILTIIAAAALVIAVLFSIDYHPASKEDLAAANEESTILGDGTAYWTQWGHSYHFDPDCHTLSRSKNVYYGTVDEAFEAGRTDPCDFCALEGGAEQVSAAAEEAAEEDSLFED